MRYNKSDFTLVPSRQARIGMPAFQQVVYMWLCEHSDDNMQCFPSRKVLAYECGLSPRSLDRCLIELEKAGYIARQTRYEENKQITSLYTVAIVTKGSQSDEGGVVTVASPPSHSGKQNSTQLTQPNRTQSNTSTDVDGQSEVASMKHLFYQLVAALGFTESVRYTDNRRNKLKSRLRTYRPDELMNAATSIGGDAFLQGDNPGGRRYGDIDFLIRSDEQIDKQLQKQAQTKLERKADW